MGGHIFQICLDDVGITVDGELFVACNECAYPVCRPRYEYECKEGSKSCTQSKTRYKRHKGSPRVAGDDEEEGEDDLDDEFSHNHFNRNEKQHIVEAMLHWKMAYGHGEDIGPSDSSSEKLSQSPLMTGKEVSGELPEVTPEHHRMTAPPPGSDNGKRVHPLPFVDPSQTVLVRVVEPTKDSKSYRVGSVAWKERVESWKAKQDKNVIQVTNGTQYSSEGKDGYVDDSVSGGEDM